MRAKAMAFGLLVGASVLDLPAVYLVMADDASDPPPVVALGLVAMGVAWAGGRALEDKRRGSVALVALCGVAQAPLLLVPQVSSAIGGAWPWVAASSAASALGLAATLYSRRGAT
ncbi:MAG TPA: hypothetical protein VHH36_06925 [Candidatus Thermoplasmatota archaeon]|nr:hypothetical protein [Candidatus Thermoplasmatota archaeon]